MMLRRGTILAAITLLDAGLSPIFHAKPARQTGSERTLNLVGEIMDSRCAIDGSHEKVMRQNGAKSARDCTLQCAKSQGSFVLIDQETQTVYQLDDQGRPVEFAGQRVRVSGTYDEPSKTMHIETIEAAQ